MDAQSGQTYEDIIRSPEFIGSLEIICGVAKEIDQKHNIPEGFTLCSISGQVKPTGFELSLVPPYGSPENHPTYRIPYEISNIIDVVNGIKSVCGNARVSIEHDDKKQKLTVKYEKLPAAA